MRAPKLCTVQKLMITTGVLALALGLAGCSGGDGSESTRAEGTQTKVEAAPTKTSAPKPTENIDKTWAFDYQGATGTFVLTGSDDDPRVQEVEGARLSVNGKPVTLVAVTIDNTAGTSSLNMYGMTIVTKDGQQISSGDLADSFSAWRDAAGDDTNKYNALVDAENKNAMFDLQPGAKGTALVAFDAPLTSAWRVTVMPAGGFDEVAATPSD